MNGFRFGFGPFFGGVFFALGLGVSGMTDPSKVIGFLDVFGQWKPELLFVMLGALGVYGTLFRLIVKRPKPLFEDGFSVPTRKDLDWKLITGAGLFGLGWGVTGFCPGPGIVNLVTGTAGVWVFVLFMLFGMIGARIWSNRAEARDG